MQRPGSIHSDKRPPSPADDTLQSQMMGLQSRMSSLGQQISDMYKRAENTKELASAGLTVRRQSSDDSVRLGSSISSPPGRGRGGSISSTVPRHSTRSASDLAGRTDLGLTGGSLAYSAASKNPLGAAGIASPGSRPGGVDGQIPLPKPAWAPVGASASSPGSRYASPPRTSSTYLTSDLRNASLHHRGTAVPPASHYRHQSVSVAANGRGMDPSGNVRYQLPDSKMDRSAFDPIKGTPSAYRGGVSTTASGFQDTPKAAGGHGFGLGSSGAGLGSSTNHRAAAFDSSRFAASGGVYDSRSTVGAPSTYSGGADRHDEWRKESFNRDRGPEMAGGGGASHVPQQQEEMRLRDWIQEMRHERRRLEDKLLMGDSHGMRALEMRDDLEKQVLGLSRQRDTLEADMGSMAAMQHNVKELAAEVDSLRFSLAHECETNANLQSAREQLEASLADVNRQLQELSQECSAMQLQHKKAVQKASHGEKALDKLGMELQHVRSELQAKEVNLAEAKATSEVLQHANAQIQAQLGSTSRDLESRVHELQRQLDEEKRRGATSATAAEASGKESTAAQALVKELSSRAEFLRSEREKALKLLQAEQQQSASLRQSVEALQSQVRAIDSQKVELDQSARIQLESLQKQYELQASTANRQYELQVSSVDKQYASLQKQYDASVQSHEKLLGIHNALRKERDELWVEADRLRGETAAVQRERDELAAKLSTLRGEVKHSMDDVVVDRDQRIQALTLQHLPPALGPCRDQRIQALTLQHQQIVTEMRERFEMRLEDLGRSGDAKLKGVLEIADTLKRELNEVQQSSDKHRSAAVHLKQQLQEVLVGRDDLFRDLEAEREFSSELNKIVNQIRAGGAGSGDVAGMMPMAPRRR